MCPARTANGDGLETRLAKAHKDYEDGLKSRAPSQLHREPLRRSRPARRSRRASGQTRPIRERPPRTARNPSASGALPLQLVEKASLSLEDLAASRLEVEPGRAVDFGELARPARARRPLHRERSTRKPLRIDVH